MCLGTIPAVHFQADVSTMAPGQWMYPLDRTVDTGVLIQVFPTLIVIKRFSCPDMLQTDTGRGFKGLMVSVWISLLMCSSELMNTT